MIEDRRMLCGMRRISLGALACGALLLGACSGKEPVTQEPAQEQQTAQPDKILVANLGGSVIQDLVISTNDGQVLWEGDLQGDQEMSFSFLPTVDGHFVVRYGAFTQNPKELHKGYFDTRGGLLHSFTFRQDGTLAQRTRRASAVSSEQK